MNKIYLLALILASLAVTAQAQSLHYITDETEVMLRSGPSNKHRIVRQLRTGTPLSVLKTDDEKGFSLVRTQDDAEGWVLTRYLVTTPIAKVRLAAAKDKIAGLEAESAHLKNQLEALTKENQDLTTDKQDLTKKNRQQSREISDIRQVAANPLMTSQENKKLKQRVVELEREQQILQQENVDLKDRNDRDWFLAGSGVVLLGMLIGFIAPKIRWRRRSNWDTL